MEIKIAQVNKDFWAGKKVFITGHTGFKGSWLSIWLKSLGSIIKGYSLEPNTNPNLFTESKLNKNMDSEYGDIRNLDQISKSISNFNPDILIHMAAQPLVRYSYINPIETYTTNVIGTANVLEGSRKCSNLKAIISVTSDKCYENNERDYGYREDESMGGYDPYSSSKGCAELVTSAYRRSYFSSKNTASLASTRSGNVIGGGDWSNDRLIPDILRAFEKKQKVIIRNPLSTRPWQHVLEPLSGYLILAEQLYLKGDDYAEAWNFGPKDNDCRSVGWILENMIKFWGDNVGWSHDKNSNPHEASLLKLDCSKAKNRLKWHPKWGLKEALILIVDWHKDFLNNRDLYKKCIDEIKKYSN